MEYWSRSDQGEAAQGYSRDTSLPTSTGYTQPTAQQDPGPTESNENGGHRHSKKKRRRKRRNADTEPVPGQDVTPDPEKPPPPPPRQGAVQSHAGLVAPPRPSRVSKRSQSPMHSDSQEKVSYSQSDAYGHPIGSQSQRHRDADQYRQQNTAPYSTRLNEDYSMHIREPHDSISSTSVKHPYTASVSKDTHNFSFSQRTDPFSVDHTPRYDSDNWDTLPSASYASRHRDGVPVSPTSDVSTFGLKTKQVKTDDPFNSFGRRDMYNLDDTQPVTNTLEPQQPQRGSAYLSEPLTSDPLVDAFQKGYLGPAHGEEFSTRKIEEHTGKTAHSYHVDEAEVYRATEKADSPKRKRRHKEKDTESKSTCIVWTLVALNILFFVVSCVAIGLGVWVLIDWTSAWVLWNSQSLVAGAWFVVISGCCLLFISLLGGGAAYFHSKSLTIAYIVPLVVVAVTFMIGGILAISYRSELASDIRRYMKLTIEEEYGVDQDEWYKRQVTYAWDAAQHYLECCGVDDLGWDVWRRSEWFKDYPGFTVSTKPYVPESCCVWDNKAGDYIDKSQCQYYKNGPPGQLLNNPESNTALYYKGCYRGLYDTMIEYSAIICGVGMAISLSLIFGIVAAVALYRRL